MFQRTYELCQIDLIVCDGVSRTKTRLVLGDRIVRGKKII